MQTNYFKATFYSCGLLFLLFLLNGCVIIPTGVTWSGKENVIGVRSDSDGTPCEQIVHRKMRLEFVAIGLTPKGLAAASHWDYSRYQFVTKESRRSIWTLAHFPYLSYEPVDICLPIPNSDRWVAVNNTILDVNEISLKLIIFKSKGGRIAKLNLPHVRRFPPKRAISLLGYVYMEGNSDLSWLRIHNMDGTCTLVNTLTGETLPELAAVEPFVPFDFDKLPNYWNHDAWKTVLKPVEPPVSHLY
ncbi:MAG: hypothetical protein IKP58_00890 [Victivallales bacterium]|nr:hypothetical protein [Victivallales bacterium]